MKPKLAFNAYDNNECNDNKDGMNTLGKLILAYWDHCSVSKRTRRNNALSLLKIIETVKGHPVKSETVPLSEITPYLISDYQNAVVAKYESGATQDKPSQREARDRALRSTRSTIRQARSLFARRGEVDLISVYKRLGFELPDSINEFCSCHVRGKNTATEYNAPNDEVVQRSMEAIELMRKDESVYLAYWLAIGALLRRNEIFYCKWEHLREVDGKPRIIGGIGKGGELIDVPMQSRAYQAILPFRKPDGWMISERSERWAKTLSAWLRGQGWKTRLTIHELRAYAGSLIYRKDPVSAMRALRHKSIQVTERNYVRYGLASDVVDVL